MKLDIDCVRDVLLEFEDYPVDCYAIDDFPKTISKHGKDNVEYTFAKLKEAGYINADIKLFPDGQYEHYGIYDITFAGHQFLETIRDSKVWDQTKKIASNVGSRTFEVITQIASTIITNLVAAQFIS